MKRQAAAPMGLAFLLLLSTSALADECREQLSKALSYTQSEESFRVTEQLVLDGNILWQATTEVMPPEAMQTTGKRMTPLSNPVWERTAALDDAWPTDTNETLTWIGNRRFNNGKLEVELADDPAAPGLNMVTLRLQEPLAPHQLTAKSCSGNVITVTQDPFAIGSALDLTMPKEELERMKVERQETITAPGYVSELNSGEVTLDDQGRIVAMVIYQDSESFARPGMSRVYAVEYDETISIVAPTP